jgi:hypothetical protein
MRQQSRAIVAGTRDLARTLVCVVLVLLAIRSAAARQDPLRTSDGRPDLQGVWDFGTLTPLERPRELAAKPFLTDQEAAALEKQIIQRNDRDRRDQSADADVGGGVNELWFDRGAHLARVNGRWPTSLLVEPADGRIPPVTADAQRRAAAEASTRRQHPADGPEDRSLQERCLAFNAGPPMLPGPYNNFVQLIQTPDHAVILNEMIHDARIVPFGRRTHLAPAIRAWLGDSIGRWEGETLVVDTTNFTDKTNFRGTDDRLHLVERFTRTGADTLLYEFTVDDPTVFTSTWSAVLPMARADTPVFEYACHEGNYALMDILRGARVQEGAFPVR